jgi:hypothetical protein
MKSTKENVGFVMIGKKQATDMLTEMEQDLKNNFNTIKTKHYNQNTKGYDYENVLKDFLEAYLGGIYDFHSRVPLIDAELQALSVFRQGKNEFDVVGTFKTAMPRIIFKTRKTSFIPYDAVAFIAEVKQTLTKNTLEDDLKKLSKLSSLKIGDRWQVSVRGQYCIERPLRILFYYEARIAGRTMRTLLEYRQDAWDLLLILKSDLLVGNPCLPAIGKRFGTDQLFFFKEFPLLHMMLITTSSLPCPPIVNAWGLFIKLLGIHYS